MTPAVRTCLLAGVVAGCASTDPLQAIPAGERAVLEAEARRGAPAPAGGDRRAAIAAMLARARSDDPAPLLLRFEGDATALDAAQREAVARFATAARGASQVVVTARTGLGAGSQMLGPRRAMAVARLLEPQFPEVELRFDTSVPDDTVRVLLPQGPAR